MNEGQLKDLARSWFDLIPQWAQEAIRVQAPKFREEWIASVADELDLLFDPKAGTDGGQPARDTKTEHLLDEAPKKPRGDDFVHLHEENVERIIPRPRSLSSDLETPNTPNTPAKCEFQCVDCDGMDHHWMTDIDHGYSDLEPDHPAAIAGLVAWDICKHCFAWRDVPEDAKELGCQKCKGPAEIVFNPLPSIGTFCRWHAIQRGREIFSQSGAVPAMNCVEAGGATLLAKVRGRIESSAPEPKILHCPECKAQHVDTGDWKDIPHKTHRCLFCHTEWRPFDACTVGVSALGRIKIVKGDG